MMGGNQTATESVAAMLSFTKEFLFPSHSYESFSSKIHHLGL